MGGGASRQKQEELAAAVAADLAKAAAHPEQERPATPPSNYDPSGARSKAWNKAYKALLDFEPPQNIDPNTLEDDPEELTLQAVLFAIGTDRLEARAARAPFTGKSLCHVAAESGAIRSLRTLLDAGCNVDARDKYRDTILHFGAKAGQVRHVGCQHLPHPPDCAINTSRHHHRHHHHRRRRRRPAT